jgi:uncharacterized membrane protein (UPF0127 family)
MNSFLSPLLRADANRYVLENTRSGEIVASDLLAAFDSAARKKGLLGRDTLASESAMIIAPCAAVHTFLMRFAIDVAFVARDGRVIKISKNLRPWRIAAAFGAFAVIEMRSGALAYSKTGRGDVLALRAIE